MLDASPLYRKRLNGSQKQTPVWIGKRDNFAMYLVTGYPFFLQQPASLQDSVHHTSSGQNFIFCPLPSEL